MDPVIEKIVLTVIGTLAGALVGAVIAYFSKNKQRLEILTKEHETREMVNNVLQTVESHLEDFKQKFEQIDSLVDARIDPLRKDMADMGAYINDIDEHQNQLEKNLEEFQQGFKETYKLRFLRLCKMYADQGCMSSEQYDQLSDLHAIYKDVLHLNGKGEEYYQRAIKVEIVSEDKIQHWLQEHKKTLVDEEIETMF